MKILFVSLERNQALYDHDSRSLRPMSYKDRIILIGLGSFKKLLGFDLDPGVADLFLRGQKAGKVERLEFGRGHRHELAGLGIEVQVVEDIESGWEDAIGVVVGFHRGAGIEEINELVGEVFFLAGMRDTEVFNGDKSSFFGDHVSDKREFSHGSPNVRAGSDGDSAVFSRNEVIGPEVCIGVDEFLLSNQKIDDFLQLKI